MPKAKVTLANMTVSASELAGVLGVTDHNVRLLTREGVLKGQKHHGTRYRYKLAESVRCFVKHREQAAKRGTTSADLAYSSARARKMAAAASLIELQLAAQRNEYLYRRDVEFHLSMLLRNCRDRLLAIPSRTMHALVGRTDAKDCNKIVGDEVDLALNEVADRKCFDWQRMKREQIVFLQGEGFSEDQATEIADDMERKRKARADGYGEMPND
jgi:phage terminase Nu1 subunit (DNA packaging protein)